jgi:hypothetical protein
MDLVALRLYSPLHSGIHPDLSSQHVYRIKVRVPDQRQHGNDSVLIQPSCGSYNDVNFSRGKKALPNPR